MPAMRSATPVPRFRGRLHQIAFFVTLPAGATLIGLARTAVARAAAAVFSASLALLFGTSAAYHRKRWSAGAHRVMKRLDHSMIFVLIGGSYTAIGLLALHGWWRFGVLTTVWSGAVAGIVLKVASIEHTRVVGGILYLTLGWVAVFASPEIVRNTSAVQIALVVAGGILYTVGAVIFFRRRPDPNPQVFGYHEIWHSFVCGASACHYAAVLLLVLAAGRA